LRFEENGALDLAILSSDVPASPPLFLHKILSLLLPFSSRKSTCASKGRMRAVVVNAGNANCATGEAGHAAAVRTVEVAAKRLGCAPQELFVCSTGVIGVPLPLEKFCRALPGGRRAFAALRRALLRGNIAGDLHHRIRGRKRPAASFKMAGTNSFRGLPRKARG